MMCRALVVATVLTAAMSLAACGTISRTDPVPLRLVEGEIMPTIDPRIRPDDEERLLAMQKDFSARLAEPDSAGTLLALSGGGANGAFGAGLLVGWTQTGNRPEFDIVTGISTGALAAPFAFLGPEWDDELQHAYTSGVAEGIIGIRGLSALVGPSLFSSAPLRRLVDENVTPELLRAIAAEHATGRRLLVVTTNLDAQESVIWDMGLLATQGDDQALVLFRRVLLASASIPGVFPPVLIAGLYGDKVVEEMHVDGGINMPFLAIPEGLLVDSPPRTGLGKPSVYIVINGQVGRDPQVVRGSLRSIVMSTYDSMSRASTRTHLVANAAYAERHRIDLRIAAIPVEAQVSALNFDRKAMTDVFEMGRARALAGDAWFDAVIDGQAVARPETTPPER
ncbi:patatin-like phospholipase family protein [Brevundimonas lenta]|uniref:PNPLA domain-containing protein n=1 Tax=Brevundimonas lenta TaxID=424796 RepID=A0A7W6NQF6_9CAUL|nr:patatin-like phospholipase family protein [Brevundimonas lenta]MBB4083162.1 hypothetical protein [Brevundimonas lenta]